MADEKGPGFNPELDTPDVEASEATKSTFRDSIVDLIGNDEDGTRELNENGEDWKSYTTKSGQILVGSDVAINGPGSDYFVMTTFEGTGPTGGPATMDVSYTLEPDGKFTMTHEVTDPEEQRQYSERQKAYHEKYEKMTPAEKLEVQQGADGRLEKSVQDMKETMQLQEEFGKVTEKDARMLVALLKMLKLQQGL